MTGATGFSYAQIRNTIISHWRQSPQAVRGNCREIIHNLKPAKDDTREVLFSRAAPIYSQARNAFSLFVRFQSLDFKLVSAEGTSYPFPQNDQSILPRYLLDPDRFSIHIPDISQDQAEFFDHDDKSGLIDYPVFRLLPVHLPRCGAALYTPLGIDMPPPFAFGFIFEHRTNGLFSLSEIYEARAFSRVFNLLMFNRRWR